MHIIITNAVFVFFFLVFFLFTLPANRFLFVYNFVLLIATVVVGRCYTAKIRSRSHAGHQPSVQHYNIYIIDNFGHLIGNDKKRKKERIRYYLSARITGSRYIICKRLRVLILNSYSHLKGDDTRFIYGAGITRPWPVMTAIPKRSFSRVRVLLLQKFIYTYTYNVWKI